MASIVNGDRRDSQQSHGVSFRNAPEHRSSAMTDNRIATAATVRKRRTQGTHSMDTISLFTIGYSGLNADTFVRRLKTAGVETVVDVRERPLSHKKGFSKNGLREMLQSHGVEYVHVRELGVPASLRARLREGGSLRDYLADFREYLKDCTEPLSTLYSMAREKACCLMCVEQDVVECHRSVIAHALSLRNRGMMKVYHL
jgi:uncharacterized protein (DUF488 family)